MAVLLPSRTPALQAGHTPPPGTLCSWCCPHKSLQSNPGPQNPTTLSPSLHTSTPGTEGSTGRSLLALCCAPWARCSVLHPSRRSITKGPLRHPWAPLCSAGDNCLGKVLVSACSLPSSFVLLLPQLLSPLLT